MLEEEKLDELDIALLRQMEREALLETVYDERRLSDAEIQTLLKERSVRALAEIHRVLDEDTPDETCFEKIELVGLCTDICVVSNALILKALFPNAEISVDSACCAGVTPETHNSALATMKMCQIDVV